MTKRFVLIVLVLALIGAGAAFGRSTASTTVVLRLGQTVYVPSLDLFCKLYAVDPDSHDPGPMFGCSRYSVFSVNGNSRSIEVSRYHYSVSNAVGSYIVYRAGRTP